MNFQELEQNFHDIVNSCEYGESFVYQMLFDLNYTDIYLPEINRPMSSRKLEQFNNIANIRLYYQKNPVKFIEDFFKIQFVDSQAYLFQMAWMTPFVLILASRAFGKSMWMVLFAMAKQMLSSTPWDCFIASGSGQQSATTFKKLEDISNNRISSLVGSTGEIFLNEVVIPNAAGNGFSHSPSGFSYSLYNGSKTMSLNSSIDRNRGFRSNCVLFDEVGFLSAELLRVYAAFCAVNEGFVTGFDKNGSPIDIVRSIAMPKNLPHQLIHVSSASDVDTEYYRMYRDYSKQMLSGNRNYFVAHIDCDLVMSPTIHNIPTTSALTREQIDSEFRTNPMRAAREYMCEFTTDAGADAIIKRGVITRNEEIRKPLHYNDTGDKKFGFFYDPARQHDNSVVLVAEFYNSPLPDGSSEIKARIVNCVNLIDVGKKIKSPMQTPDQVEYIKQMILDYDGGTDAYNNIVGIWIDAGSGGAGVNIADFFMNDWVDKAGIQHRGLIDKEFSAEYVKRYPNAVDKIHLMNPSTYKSIMYEALIEMLNQNKISFTASYDHKGYLTVFDIDEKIVEKETKRISEELKKKKVVGEEFDKQLKEKLNEIQSVKTKTIKLDWKDELALSNIDALKEEAVNMIRKRRESGKDSFELTPEKANRLHDDRIYTCSMLGWALSEERRKDMLKKPKGNPDLINQLPIRKQKRFRSI